MACTCGSNRIAGFGAKCSDMSSFNYPALDIQKDGYVPYEVGIGGGDYVEFNYCLDCGRIQDKFPVTDEQLHVAFS